MSYTKFPARFGKYVLLDRLNSGGMAEVYRAKVVGVEKFQRLCAIKCMLPSLNEDEQFTTMFIDEAKLAAQLSHANVVQIYELGRMNDQLYIAMELINGRDLRHVIRRVFSSGGRMPVGFAAYVVSKAAEGLDFAHRKIGVDGTPINLVHRDVSPQNILVSYDGEVKVVDFGIAKAEVRDTKTRAGVLKGKFAYMAPEQVTGGDIDRRTDIFALGAVLYEVMTGKKLFGGESDFSILEKVRAASVPDLSRELPGAPPELQEILRKALARDVSQRYEFASDLAEDLTPMLIDNRSIFGAKQAKEFMLSMFTDDIRVLGEAMREYSQVNIEACVESSAERRLPKPEQVFESAFADKSLPRNGATDLACARASDTLLPAAVAAAESDLEDFEVKTTVSALPGSGWNDVTGATAPGGLGDATQLFAPATRPNEGNSDDLVRPAFGLPALQSQAALRSAPGAASAAEPAPAAGVRTATSRVLLGGLAVAAILMLSVAVLILVTTRTGSSGATVVTPVTLPAGPSGVPTQDGAATVHPQPAPPALPAQPDPQAEPGAGVAHASPDEVQPDAKDEGGRVSSKKRPPKPPVRVAYGYMSVKAGGVVTAKVYVDGKEAGYSPLVFHRVRIGKHKVKIVEQTDGKAGRSKVVDVNVGSSNTNRKDALRVLVDL